MFSRIGRFWREPGPTVASSSRSRLFALRREAAKVFTDGEYRPLKVEGRDADEIVAFARCREADAVLIIVARLFDPSTRGGRRWPSPAD